MNEKKEEKVSSEINKELNSHLKPYKTTITLQRERKSFNQIPIKKKMNIQNNTKQILNKEVTIDVCRVCLSSNKNNKYIYSTIITNEFDHSQVELKQILQLHGGIELAENDGLPSNICQECFFKVHTANKLWKQCQLTDQKLRAIYEKPESKLTEFNSQLAMETSCEADMSTEFLSDEIYEVQSHEVIMNGDVSAEKSSSTSEKLPINILNSELSEIKNEDLEYKDNHWANRSRRLSMFKRVTSLEKLTSNKERQRNHMKNNKNSSSKSDNINDENSDNTAINNDNKRKRSPQYQCSQCDEKYSTKKSLYRHCLTHEEKTKQHSKNDESIQPINCNICKKNFKKPATLIRHLNSHKKTNPTDVYNILKKIRNKKKSERLSSKTSMRNNSLKDHKKIRIKSKIIDPMERSSQTSLDTEATIELVTTWIKEELSKAENKIKDYCCSTCGKFYMTKKSLLKHNRNQHEKKIEKTRTKPMKENNDDKINDEANKYQCNKCIKTFSKEFQLHRHLKVHDNNEKKLSLDHDTNFKRFLCHICSKTFRQNTGLMFHMRTHTGYKPHTCKYCGRGFTSNSNCINHERTHTGDRPFICHFCSAAFAKSCTLKSHITTHTGEANYHCKTCGKSFRRLKYLKEHKFTHTGEKPYACKICGTAYSHSGSLFVHEKKCKAQLNNCQSTTANAIDSQTFCHPDPNDCPMIDEFSSQLDTLSINKNYGENLQGTDGVSGICDGLIEHSVNDSINANAIQSLPISNQTFNS